MTIHGREVTFKKTVGAACAIEKLSETAGGVSISYSGSALSSQGMLLPGNVRAALAPYKVVRSHAA